MRRVDDLNNGQRWALVVAVVFYLWAAWALVASFQVRVGRYVFQQITCGPPALRLLHPAHPTPGQLGSCWNSSVAKVRNAVVVVVLSTAGAFVAVRVLRDVDRP